MIDYHGSAELLDSKDGVLGEVTVYLKKLEGSELQDGEWGGIIDPISVEVDLDQARTIRLPSGETANIFCEDIETTFSGPFGTSQSATIRGSGPPPF